MAHRLVISVTTVLALASCGSSSAVSLSPRPTPTHTATATATATPSADPCAVGMQTPPGGTIPADFATALAFAPDGRLFYAERSGNVKVWQDGGAHTFASVTTVTTERGGGYSERGLLGLALSPTFAQDRFVYAFYSDADYSSQHVVRWTDCKGTGMNATVIITLPSGGDCCHKGGRIAFGADGKLYVTLGDEHSADTSQAKSDVRGKILRYNPDGSVPGDDPFGPGNPVWAFGFRNPFGIAFSPSGQLAVTSNGPTGDAGSPSTGYDVLIESVQRGQGYQWPLCYGYSHALQQSGCGGQPQPDWSSETSTVVPTGAAFIDASGPAQYASHLVFCTLNRGMLIVTPGSPHASVTRANSDCLLDVKQGPDHALYFSDTSSIHRAG